MIITSIYVQILEPTQPKTGLQYFLRRRAAPMVLDNLPHRLQPGEGSENILDGGGPQNSMILAGLIHVLTH